MVNEADILEEVIAHLDTLYEVGDDCIHPHTNKLVSDAEYDQMRSRLKVLRPNSKLFDTPTASQNISVVKKVKHEPPMTSISKANGTLIEKQAILKHWEEEVIKELHYKESMEKWAVGAYKWDGVAVALYYVRGKLVKAGLRPRDGVNGEDITANIRYVEGVKLILPEPITGTLRGEVICKKSVFEQMNKEFAKRGEKTFANPRNYAAGSLRQFKDPTITGDRKLSFCCYIIISDDVKEMDEIERAKWCNKVLMIPYVQVRPFREEYLQKMEDNAKLLDYEVDGIVISVRNIEDREQMGAHGGSPTGNPKGRLAWKFSEEYADCKIKAIECNTGRTGKIVPVLIFDPVQLAGTKVTQCTGHNLGFMLRNKITLGTTVRIEKSGKIIPKVIDVVSGKGDWKYPNNCPSCGAPTKSIQNKDMSELVCSNHACPAQIVNGLCHYLTTLGVKGLAESTVDKLVVAELVETPNDFYCLSVQDLLRSGLSNRQSLLALASIWMIEDKSQSDDDLLAAIKARKDKKLKIPLWQLFAAFGVEGAGKSAGRALMSHFGSLDKMRQASLTTLNGVEDVGPKTAQAIYTFFQNSKFIINALLDFIEPLMPKVGKLTGKTFCLTGGFEGGKEKLQREIEDLGGKCASSVSKKVDFVVVGENAGSKADKAIELGIKTLNPSELKKMF
jgi:DNA ligase (NAD+)